jgi:hypothetical protein
MTGVRVTGRKTYALRRIGPDVVAKLLDAGADLANYPEAQHHLLKFFEAIGVPGERIRNSKMGAQLETSARYSEFIRDPQRKVEMLGALGLKSPKPSG